MKKTIIPLVPLCCLLVACASDKQVVPAYMNCPQGPVERECPTLPNGTPDPAKRNKIQLVVSAKGIEPRPAVVCAKPNTTITVTVVGIPGDATRVATVPKDDADKWILSSRTGNGVMSIKVPDGTSEAFYEYLAMTSTGKCVDPMIHVD
jgi:hypothetical protein